jgi:hypothetical protein
LVEAGRGERSSLYHSFDRAPGKDTTDTRLDNNAIDNFATKVNDKRK